MACTIGVEVLGVDKLSVVRDGKILNNMKQVVVHLSAGSEDPRVLFLTHNDDNEQAFTIEEVVFDFRLGGYRFRGKGVNTQISYNEHVLSKVQDVLVSWDVKQGMAKVKLEVELQFKTF
jgi:hypothetical protein